MEAKEETLLNTRPVTASADLVYGTSVASKSSFASLFCHDSEL